VKVKQKGIYLFSIPYSNFKEQKIRPALIISNNKLNNSSEDCIILPLTSNIKNEQYSIIINNKNLDSGKLIKRSRVRFDKIFNIEQKSALQSIGAINNETLQTIRKEILKLI
jgi:mRNA interferase MazF